jgi:hypothetical protein
VFFPIHTALDKQNAAEARHFGISDVGELGSIPETVRIASGNRNPHMKIKVHLRNLGSHNIYRSGTLVGKREDELR